MLNRAVTASRSAAGLHADRETLEQTTFSAALHPMPLQWNICCSTHAHAKALSYILIRATDVELGNPSGGYIARARRGSGVSDPTDGIDGCDVSSA